MTSIVAIILATVLIIPASAQSLSTEPLKWKNDNNKTIYFKDKATGEQVGSAFITGNRTYLRDRHNKHYATVIKEPDGTTKWLDPSGQPLDPKTTMFPVQ